MERTRTCKKCSISQNWFGTVLDSEGICNYCHYYDKVGPKLSDFDRWYRLFQKRIERYLGKYEYDAVVGFSGGKDSTYVIHALKSQYNLRVLAATLEFSFMPTTEIAKKNMKNTAAAMDVEHIVFKAPDEIITPVFRNAMKKHGVPCGLCTQLCLTYTEKVAYERRIPLVVDGLDRAQMFRDLLPNMRGIGIFNKLREAYSTTDTLKANIADTRTREYQQNLRLYSYFGLSPEDCTKFFSPPGSFPGTNDYWQRLSFFLYHPYNEKEIKRTLKQEIGWEQPPDDNFHFHHDCVIGTSLTYFKRAFYKTTDIEGEVGVSVREGMLTIDEARETLRAQNEKLDNLEHPYKAFDEYLGMSEEQILQIGRSAARKMKIFKILSPLLRFLDMLQRKFSRRRQFPVFDDGK